MNRDRHRQGMALLLVLATCLIASAAAVGAVAAIARSRSAAIVEQQQAAIDVLRRDAEAAVAEWCRRAGVTLVTPPQRPWRPTLVVEATWPDADGRPSGSLRAWVWDGCSSHPPAVFQAGHPLGLACAGPWPAALRRATAIERQRSDLLAIVELQPGQQRFPDPIDRAGDDGALALAIAPHADGRVNINTAPLPLIAAIARELDVPLDLDRLRRDRERGLRQQLPPADAAHGDRLAGVRLIDRTDRWQALIDLRLGSLRRTWWVAFALGAPAGSTGIPVGDGDDLFILIRHAVAP